MPDAVICPTQQQLAAFGLGKLPEPEVAAVAAHLESCSKCTLAVAAVTKDSFIKKVRDANLGGSSFPPNPPRSANTPPNVARQTPPASLCPNLPPELANHKKYRILRELGRGGMGVVYQARHKEMDRQVVIKVINRSLLDNPDALERFRREIQAAASLSHPNIVAAYDAEKIGDLHMLVMEFVPGQNLAELLERKGPFPVVYACHFARQVALGLQHAHERGLVHRDIKPQNLILTLKNQVKILDFGLAKVISEGDAGKGITASDAYMGTPDYCAPEQSLDAAKADIRADLYSLGCTLYCLLSGRPPFLESTRMKIAIAHLEKEPQPLRELRADVPESLWQVVARLLAKEPGQRYQKPLEVVQALAPFVKPGAKPDGKSGPVSVVASPARGTMLAADTGQIKKVLREVPGKTPPKQVPAKNEASPFADLTDTGAAPMEVVRVREVAKPSRAAWWKRPGVLAAAISVSFALILMTVIIIKMRGAIVVLEIDQPGAEVFVDGQKITVHVPGDNEPIEIKVEPGQHKLRVRKDGFEVVTRNVELKSGKSTPIRVRLEPVRTVAKRKETPQVAEKVEEDGKQEQGTMGSGRKKQQKARLPFLGLRAGQERDDNGLKMKLCWCPAGKGTMRFPGLAPFTLTQGFWMGKYAVTQREWEKLMGNNPSFFSPNGGGKSRVNGMDTSEFPVEQVNWNEVSEFCEKLTQQERQAGRLPNGWEYRLPTEAQHARACQAGTTTEFFFGADRDKLGDYAWFMENSDSRTHEVGTKKPNPWGLHDMNGNVWQWCRDSYKRFHPLGGGIDPEVTEDTNDRVIRGGCWRDTMGDRVWALRSEGSSADSLASRANFYGFRVALVQSGH